MGFFDRFKKNETAPDPLEPSVKPIGPTVAELARVISSGDEAVLRDITACTEDPAGWFASHHERYEERSVDSPDDPDLVQWLGLVDILEEHGWVCDRDWKAELEDFLFFLQNLKGYQALQLTLDPDWFIPAWCGILSEKWEGVCVAAIDIDSDCYVLFPTAFPQLAQLQKLAEEIGHRIVAVERM